jgi:sugar lactone lactonase YvrE
VRGRHIGTVRHFFLFLLAVGLIAAIVIRVRYGGGEPFPDVSTPPLLVEAALEDVLSYPEPIGNVAISKDGRIFFTVHPESRPQGNKLLEWVDGAAVPYPNGGVQPALFNTVLGLEIDRQNRLWTIDNGNHGFAAPRLLAFDLADGNILHDHKFRPETAPAGSFLQDVQISADGQTVFIADASIWRKRPAIVVYDVATRAARRVLESHTSVVAQNFVVRNPIRDMRFFGGLVSLKAGIDGIAVDDKNDWLYFAAMNNDGLYRVSVRDLVNPDMTARELEKEVERFSDKPMSDGLDTDLADNIYITDVEHGSVFIVGQDRELKTIIRSRQIRWADGLSFGPNGWLYLADSAIPELILKSKEHIRSQGPYHIYRFKPGITGH